MSQKDIAELLSKHRIVKSMVHAQVSRNHDVVETLVHRQHLVELQTLLSQLSPTEIGKSLDALTLEDAELLWQQVEPKRRNDILWEISNALGEHLTGANEPEFCQGQIAACELIDGRMRIVDVTNRSGLESLRPIWIDVLRASKSERNGIALHFGLELPDPEDVTDLEVSARFYVEENDEIHLHSNFLLDREGKSQSVPVAFIVHGNILFTVRNEELPVFRLQRLRARNQPGNAVNCMDMLLDLYFYYVTLVTCAFNIYTICFMSLT
ncbi:hypothetical protein WCLP8_1300001 [uncultured Gammaproteobacteria bacterium]